ncbi:IS110 family transposase [Mucilaginibacter sp. BJC16-A38]|uniref:IS110 family transposase n=1 Tax=Mucilaginibacter phenanthrenivorans TaxID=1234842 RepID=UPI002157A72B|nr:IS110 family transposase [Mucilaginibacter phenanthrenivorans]MCR8556906.1 IS110 family transposase [Mucilaginibacter phenanthrenivorans]
MEFDFFIGTDVSKGELDFAVMQGEIFLFHREISNQPDAIKGFVKELIKLPGFDLTRAVFCMEHTGIYNNHLLVCLHQKKANICLEAATQIKNSQGNIRGKNDKIDAIRIADYAYTQRKKLRLWQPKRQIIQQLFHLTAVRSRLIAAKKLLRVPLGEHDIFSVKNIAKQSTAACAHTLKAIDDDLDRVDAAMDKIIAADDELKRLFALVTSVSGIGKVVATQILIATNEFKDINNPKKFACYSGVVPFTDDSGKVKKKGRVSHMANKKIKTLLHLAAIVAIQHNPDMKSYYQRMVTIEKKNKMSVINAVRNKLVLRVFACVNQNRAYENNYHKLLA